MTAHVPGGTPRLLLAAQPVTDSKTTPPFAVPLLAAAGPPVHCICSWVWCPALSSPGEPFVRKYANRACPARHGGTTPQEGDGMTRGDH